MISALAHDPKTGPHNKGFYPGPH